MQIPLQNTRLDHLMQATKGVLLRGRTKPTKPHYVDDILEELQECREDMRTTMERTTTPIKAGLVRTVYNQERDSLSALELHLQAGAKQPVSFGGDRQRACARLLQVLYTNQEGYGRKDAVGIHDAAEQRLGLIDKRYLGQVAIAGAEPLVDGLRAAHAATDAVLHLRAAPEPVSIKQERARLTQTAKRAMLRINTWADTRLDERQDALEVLQPLLDLIAYAKESSQKTREAAKTPHPGSKDQTPSEPQPSSADAPTANPTSTTNAPATNNQRAKDEAPSTKETLTADETSANQDGDGAWPNFEGPSPRTPLAQAFAEGLGEADEVSEDTS